MSARVMLMVRWDVSSGDLWPRNCALSDELWWLIEADSADAARKVIEHFEHNGEPCVHGRVLAHVGRK